jgi:hypothetical protein
MLNAGLAYHAPCTPGLCNDNGQSARVLAQPCTPIRSTHMSPAMVSTPSARACAASCSIEVSVPQAQQPSVPPTSHRNDMVPSERWRGDAMDAQ